MNPLSMPQHQADDCRCLVSGSALAVVRRVRLLSLEAIASGSSHSPEYLSDVERCAKDKCADLKVVDSYEKAMGTAMEAALALFTTDLAKVALQVREMIHRLIRARKQEAEEA